MKMPSTDLPLKDDDSSSLVHSETQNSKPLSLKKKKKRLNTLKFKCGRWDLCEHKQFLELFMKYKKNWKKIESFMNRRTAEQIRSHSQKYVIKLIKKHLIKKTKDGKIIFNKSKHIHEEEKAFVEYFFHQNNHPRIFKIEKNSFPSNDLIKSIKKSTSKKFLVIPQAKPMKTTIKQLHKFAVQHKTILPVTLVEEQKTKDESKLNIYIGLLTKELIEIREKNEQFLKELISSNLGTNTNHRLSNSIENDLFSQLRNTNSTIQADDFYSYKLISNHLYKLCCENNRSINQIYHLQGV